jgi:RNA polymerase sigma-70 factor (ECF subfamily)
MPAPSLLNRDLVRSALAGDPACARRLVNELTPVIRKRVSRALAQRRSAARGRDLQQEVMDLMQQVFEILFADRGRVLQSWDPDRGLSLPNFVGLVAEREVASILRSGKRSPWTDDPTLTEELASTPAEEPAPDMRVLSQDLLEQLLDALRTRLSPASLAIFTMIFVEERTIEEVCAELHTTPKALYVWRSRARGLVRALLCELAPDLALGARPTVPREAP